ncbi:MAG: iron ABC transporter permease [Anaerolineaceae bacterium]|nr:MAG: iron ABC transporter permease [Anaerolineaceae bacterium]
MEGILTARQTAGQIAQRQMGRIQRQYRRLPFLRIISITIVVLLLIPVAYLVLRAVDSGQDGIDYLLRPRTLNIVQNSLNLVAAVSLSAVVVGVPFAWLTSRANLPLRRVWLVLGMLPMVVPSYVAAIALIRMFGPSGLFEATFGFNPMPPIYGFFGSWLIITLMTFPYVALPVRAAFMNMDPSLEEAARGLGGGRWRVFWRVTFPQLRPALAGGMLLTALYTLSDFGVVMLLRYNAFTRAIYISYENSFNPYRAAVLALVLVFLTVGLLLLERYISRGRRNYKVGTGAARRPPMVDLGVWRWPAMLFCAVPVAFGLILPVVVLLGWALNPNVTSALNVNLGALTVNTVGVSGLAAVTAGVVALPLAILAVRSRTGFSRWMVNTAYMGNALPGVVIGLALVYFGIRVLPGLYQTMPILIAGYLLRFLPFTLASTSGALTQINPSIEEAARGLGLRPHQVIWRVTLPMAWTGILAGVALVFLNTMKELPATLMLRPTGFDTLSTRIWTASDVGSYGLIGLPGLVLIAVSCLSLTLILARDRWA